MAIAATIEVSWVCAPDASATGVRDEREELAVLVHVLAATAGERARQDARVGGGDEGDPERGRRDGDDVAQHERRQAEWRQAGRKWPHDHDPGSGREPEGCRHDRRPDDRDEDAGHAGPSIPQAEDDRETGQPDRRGDRVGLAIADAGDEPNALSDDRVAARAEPEQPGQLADDDDQRDAVEVALPHGSRQEIGQEPESGERRPHDDQADEDRQKPGQCNGARLVAGRERHDRRGDDRQQRRVGPEDQDPRGTEQRVGQERQDGRIQADDRGQPGCLGVAHPGRDEDRGQDEPREDVMSQRGALIGADPFEPGQDRSGVHRAECRALPGHRARAATRLQGRAGTRRTGRRGIRRRLGGRGGRTTPSHPEGITMATRTRGSTANGTSRSASSRTSPEPKLAPLGKEIQRFGSLRLLPIALSADARADSCRLLNEILADSMVLYAMYKKHHWLVAGPTFYQLHLLFDKHAEEQTEIIDLLAERVQSLGGIAVGDPRHAAELTTIERAPDGAEDVPAMIHRTLDAHETILEKVRDAIDKTEKNSDWGSNDILMSDVLRPNELQVWFIAEHVVDLPLIEE